MLMRRFEVRPSLGQVYGFLEGSRQYWDKHRCGAAAHRFGFEGLETRRRLELQHRVYVERTID